MDALHAFVAVFVFALLRFLPVMTIPALSPLAWAPAMVRLTLLVTVALATVLLLPAITPQPQWQSPTGLLLVALGELLIGITFGLALLIPNAALHTAGWVIDMQAGLSAASIFDPAGRLGAESLMGHALMLLATVLFFILDLHLLLFGGLVASVELLPLGAMDIRLDPEGFLSLLGRSFLLGLMVVAPVLLGLFCVDLGVAYATRSMPQANVYFLALPLKIGVGLWMLALSLGYVPELVGRLYRDAFGRLPHVFGAG